MGKLIIDGNKVYEIDEECARKKKVPKECGIYEKMICLLYTSDAADE